MQNGKIPTKQGIIDLLKNLKNQKELSEKYYDPKTRDTLETW